MTTDFATIEANLAEIISEISLQADVGSTFPDSLLSFDDTISRLREWVEEAGEYGIAYESVVSMLEASPFNLSGGSAVKLLEVGLLLGFKTERPQDDAFDRRT